MVRARTPFSAAGITTLRVEPAGRALDERLATLAHVIALAREGKASDPVPR
jgi:hypothetical protein